MDTATRTPGSNRHEPRSDELSYVRILEAKLAATSRALAASAAATTAAEHRFERILKFLAFLNRANTSILGMHCVTDTLAEICEAAVTEASLQVASAIIIDAETGDVLSMTRRGTVDGLPQAISESADARMAMSQRRAVYVDEILADARTVSRKHRVRTRGLGSSASIPIIGGGTAIGALTLYSAEAGYFSTEVRPLLESVATSLSLAVTRFRQHQDSNIATTADASSDGNFARAFGISPTPVRIVSLATRKLKYANPASDRFFGRDPQEGEPQEGRFAAMFPDPDYRREMESLFESDLRRAAMQDGMIVVDSPEMTVQCRDGSRKVVRRFLSVTGDDVILQFEDLTEVRRSHALLQRSERQFKGMIEESPAGFYVIQNELIHYVNPRFCEIVGAPQNSLLGKKPKQVLGETDGAHGVANRQVNGSRSSNQPTPEYARFLRSDNSAVVVRLHATRGVWESESATIVMVEDVTEQDRASQELVSSERRFREALDGMIAGCAIIDRDLRYLYVNESAARHRRQPRWAFIGRTVYDLFPGAVGSEIAAMYHRVMQSQRGETLDTNFSFPDGQIGSFRLKADIAPEGVFVLSEDLTASRIAELALRDSREFNRAVLDSVTTEIAVLDRDGVIVAVNEPWSRFARDNSQTPGKEASGTGVGTNYLEVCDADDNPASDGGRWFGGGIRAVLSGEISVFRAEYPCASPDEERWFKASVTPLRTSAGGAVVAHIDVTARKRSERIIAEHMCKLEETMHGTLEAIASMVEMRDPYTAGHERRVGVIAADIARELGWPAERCQNLQLVGLVHDIGKISIPAEILTKPGRLTPLEYMLVQNHAQQGYEILKNIPFPFPLAEIVQQHHERMDGSGYPMRLKGEEILMEARILAVADVLESMASHRPYRPAMGIEVAMAELEGDQGTRYDPAVVDACIRLIRNRAYALPS